LRGRPDQIENLSQRGVLWISGRGRDASLDRRGRHIRQLGVGHGIIGNRGGEATRTATCDIPSQGNGLIAGIGSAGGA
jgi:hypothetical protein